MKKLIRARLKKSCEDYIKKKLKRYDVVILPPENQQEKEVDHEEKPGKKQDGSEQQE